jgi:predicted alpha/beta-hydrolase family hydrolase
VEREIRTTGVHGVLHEPGQPGGDAIVLTHGAGSDSNAPLLVRCAQAFSAAGYFVLRYDLPFRRLRPKGSPHPSGAARDREGAALAVESMRAIVSGRIMAGGHSYGGRQTAMAAAERPHFADALLLLSYPLHPPAKPEQKRTAFFPALAVPALFVHGTADPFGTIDDLRAALSLIPARTDLLPVQRAGHDLKRAPDLAAEILARLKALLS